MKDEQDGCRKIPTFSLSTAGTVACGKHSGTKRPWCTGDAPHLDPGSKEAVGTATSAHSHVWFTLEGGILTEVYYPRLDTADVRTLEFAVSDGKKIWIDSRDLLHSIERINENALTFRQTSRDPEGHFALTKTYITDPQRDTLLIDVTFSGAPSDSLYVLYDPALKNSGYGDTGFSQDQALIAQKEDVATALISSAGFAQMSSGYAGASDGYTDLLLHHRLDWEYAAQRMAMSCKSPKFLPQDISRSLLDLVLYHRKPWKTLAAASAAILLLSAQNMSKDGRNIWAVFVMSASPTTQFQLAAMVLKAHEDKTYPGAMMLR